MFLGMGSEAPKPGMGDEPENQQLARVKKKLDQLAQPQPGQGDLVHNELNAVGGAEITKDFAQFNPVVGPEYGSSKPTGDKEKEGLENQAKAAEELRLIREQIEKLPGGKVEKEHAATPVESIFDQLDEAA